MTILGTRRRARVLLQEELSDALEVCAERPVASVLAAARIEIAARSSLAAAGGQLWGFPAAGPLEAVCWAGANIVPVLGAGAGPDAIGAFAELALRRGRTASSLVGDRAAVLALWRHLEGDWSAREVRDDQPSLVIARSPDVAADPTVHRSRPQDLGRVLPACVAMFTEEVGYSPVAGAGGAYAQRVASLIADGRSFVRTAAPDVRSPVVFKAEIGAQAGDVAQIQGVWVEPAHRGRGLAAPGVAAVVEAVRSPRTPMVSLYVNSYNAAALATYRRVGFEQVGTYATVLL